MTWQVYYSSAARNTSVYLRFDTRTPYVASSSALWARTTRTHGSLNQFPQQYQQVPLLLHQLPSHPLREREPLTYLVIVIVVMSAGPLATPLELVLSFPRRDPIVDLSGNLTLASKCWGLYASCPACSGSDIHAVVEDAWSTP